MRFDLSDALIILGLALAGGSLWQINPWLAPVLVGMCAAVLGWQRSR